LGRPPQTKARAALAPAIRITGATSHSVAIEPILLHQAERSPSSEAIPALALSRSIDTEVSRAAPTANERVKPLHDHSMAAAGALVHQSVSKRARDPTTLS
jgi:hypothetical protein